MADSFVQLNAATSAGDKADAETLTVGLNTVKRERDQIAGKGATEIAEVKDADPAPGLNGLVTRPYLPVGAAAEHVTAASPHAARLTDGTAFYKATTPADTQPITGTVTANQGSPNTVGNAWPISLVGNGGVNVANVNALNHLETALHQWGGGSVTSAAALADNTANPIAPLVGACGMAWDGAAWDRLPGDNTNGLRVDLGTNNDVIATTTPIASATATAAGNSAIGTGQVSLLSANANRLGFCITNTGTTIIYIGHNASVTATAGANQGQQLLPGGSYSGPPGIRITAAIHAIGDAAGGAVAVHEYTA